MPLREPSAGGHRAQAVTSSGHARCQRKSPCRDCDTHHVIEPLGFMGRSAALVPPLAPVPKPLAALLTAFVVPILCLRGRLLPDRLPGKERL